MCLNASSFSAFATSNTIDATLTFHLRESKKNSSAVANRAFVYSSCAESDSRFENQLTQDLKTNFSLCYFFHYVFGVSFFSISSASSLCSVLHPMS